MILLLSPQDFTHVFFHFLNKKIKYRSIFSFKPPILYGGTKHGKSKGNT